MSIGLLVLSCNNGKPRQAPIPQNMQPDWTGVDISNLPIKFGQCLNFKIDSIRRTAIVLDFDKDEGGLWIGLCFMKDTQIFGRQIPSAFINTYCLDLVDLTYLNVDDLADFQIIDFFLIDKTKVGIGSVSPVSNLSELNRDYNRGIELRKKSQTPCNKGLIDIKAVRECYFSVEKIKD